MKPEKFFTANKELGSSSYDLRNDYSVKLSSITKLFEEAPILKGDNLYSDEGKLKYTLKRKFENINEDFYKQVISVHDNNDNLLFVEQYTLKKAKAIPQINDKNEIRKVILSLPDTDFCEFGLNKTDSKNFENWLNTLKNEGISKAGFCSNDERFYFIVDEENHFSWSYNVEKNSKGLLFSVTLNIFEKVNDEFKLLRTIHYTDPKNI